MAGTGWRSICLAALLCGACIATPNISDGGGTVDFAGKSGSGCSPGDTRSCGCLGSTAPGTKTCGSNGVFGVCTGCTVDPGMDLSTGPVNVCAGCQGCCDNGTCLPLANETDGKCGGIGKTCAACASPATCNVTSGKCVTPVGVGGTCAGCLDSESPPACIAPADTDFTACGTGGAMCQQCPTDGGLCESGTCTDKIDPNQTYEVSIRVIDETTASGLGFFTCSGDDNPDPYLCLAAKDASNMDITGCSGRCDSAKICNLSESDGVVRVGQDGGLADATNVALEVPGAALIAGTVGLSIWSYAYLTSNDLVGEGKLPAMTQLKGGMLLMAGPYSSASGCPQAMIPIQYEVKWVF